MSVNYYDSVCRLCLSSRGELLPIFSTTSSDDTEPHVLASKIKDCVSVQINENDDLPSNACRKCVDNVNNWHIFKDVCEKTQNKLLSLKKDGSLLEEVKVKSEPLSDEAYDDGVVIDGSYPDFEQNGSHSIKIQPEGPPILASLGLTPKSDKGVDSENNEEEDEEEESMSEPVSTLPNLSEVSITVMRPSGETLRARQGIQQLASKNCLVCGREYRYSHNARRHELTAHSFDRYTNKVTPKKPTPQLPPKLRPNPFNPKARLLPNPLANKMRLLPRSMPNKMVPHKVIPKPVPIKPMPQKQQHNNLPYPLRIKALKDLQIKKKEPQILKTLLTTTPEVLVSEPEIINSGPGSPETLISEPEISSFQVETILTEPDAYDSQPGEDDAEDEEQNDGQKTYDTVNMESDNEIEIARQREEPENEEQSDELEGEDKMSDGEAHAEENEYEQHDENQQENQEDDEYDGHEDAVLDETAEDRADEYKETEEGNDEDAREHDESQEEEADEEGDDDEELPPMAPVVEINEHGEQADDEHDADNTVDPSDAVDEDGDPEAADEPADGADETADGADETADGEGDPSLLEEGAPDDPDKMYVTKAQREFIRRHRDVIEQINTKRCLCCEKDYPRRKSVIQHLQKNGHKVPKHTCYNCVVTFGHIGALLSHMRANVCTNLWKIIYNENGISDDMVIDPVNPRPQYKDIFNARSYACKLCPAKFQLKQSMTKHVLDTHEDGQSQVPKNCVHCRYRFKDRNQLKKHQRNGDCIINIACDLCTEKFENVQDFNNHALEQHAGNPDLNQSSQSAKCVDGRPTECPICEKKIGTYQTVVKHLKTYHDEQRPHYCQNCDDKFEKPEELHKHIFTAHSQQALGLADGEGEGEVDMSIVKEEAEEYHYSCTECNAIFETVDAWTDHQVAEHNQVAHHCDQCEKKFLRPSELAEHKNTHLRVKLYPCSVCADSYSTPQRLAEHAAAAHPGAPPPAGPLDFYCGICIRGFKSRQAYSNHMRVHAKVPTTNRRPAQDPKGFSPQIIGKPIKQFPVMQPGFVQFKPNCNVPNAPYSCDICGKGFMHKKNIWKHKKVLHADIVGERNDSEENTMHGSTEDEEFNVDENGIALSTPRFNSFNFSNIANSAAPATPPPAMFACDLCYKKFPLRSSLIKHKRAKHGVVNPPPGPGEPSSGDGSRSSCTICKITFSDKKSYYRHRKNVHKSGSQACKICGIPLGSTLELYEHLKAAHARELLGYNANQGATSKPPAAPELDVDYEAPDQDADPNSEYQARYPCDNCGKQFVGLLALQNHQCVNQNVETTSQTFNCEICHKSYTSIAALKSHRGWHLRSPDGKAAANNTSLWMPQHKVTNKVSKHEVVDAIQLAKVSHSTPVTVAKRRLPPEVEVTVVNPNKKLRSDDSMEVEQNASASGSADDRYCTICDKEFTKRAAYQRHMDEVHQPNSVFCPVCDKSFTRKSTLLVHMRKHYEGGEGSSSGALQEEEAYACDLCEATFATPAMVRAHKVKHHGEESEEEEEEEEEEEAAETVVAGEFTCGQCGDGVATPRDLIAHRAMHATPSKYFCTACKVYFARGSELATHTRARHADSDKAFFPCAMCDRFYMNKKSLQRHIDQAH